MAVCKMPTLLLQGNDDAPIFISIGLDARQIGRAAVNSFFLRNYSLLTVVFNGIASQRVFTFSNWKLCDCSTGFPRCGKSIKVIRKYVSPVKYRNKLSNKANIGYYGIDRTHFIYLSSRILIR